MGNFASIDDLLRIERKAYPYHMQQMQDCCSWEDLADYAECDEEDLVILGQPGRWYAIIALHGDEAEAVDLAKIPGTATVPWRSLAVEIRRRGIRRLRLDARASTSYAIITTLAPRLGFHVETVESWDWDGVAMFEMDIAVEARP
jgi:hypothetical protein